MYFVNREKIEEILTYMEKILDEYSKSSYHSFSDKLAIERLTHISIEAIIDVGNMMIDGFIMRDPGSYEDIIDILTDEQVLPEEEQEGYKQLIGIRKMIVQNYTAVDHHTIKDIWSRQFNEIQRFPDRIRYYLNHELGPVSAFSNDNK
ncbi:MAG: DUF86 domain-containing protein [Halobacillus sp.]|uniref:type VII toxin-antitoxin system HepT family RNase toxin n=1 Tax=Halobacillus sp. TaxID=56800 RepID=UPI003BAF9F99